MSGELTLLSQSAIGNPLAEAAVIGAMLMDNRVIDRAGDRLHPADFSDPLYSRVFGAIVAEYARGRVANTATVHPLLHGDLDYEKAGGAGLLMELTSSLAALAGHSSFIEQVAELAARRRLVDGLHEAIGRASSSTDTISSLIDLADKAIVDASVSHDPIHQVTGAQAIGELLATYDQPQNGVTCTIIPSIDRALGSLRPKSLTITAARPGMGKTATAISYALGTVQANQGTLFISMEMGSTELAGRMAADLCFNGHGGVPYESIRDGKLSPAQLRQVRDAQATLADYPLYIVDVGHLTIGRLSMLVRRYKRRLAARGEKLDLVIVDYLQLLSADGKKGNRNEEVTEISRGLKVIAKDQDVAVLALSQLSREVEKRADKRPTLSDLRESGAIEQDADAVMFLYRHEYYLRLAEPDDGDEDRAGWEAALRACEGKIDFIVAKRRNGCTGTRTGEFWGGNQAVRG